MNYYYYVVAQVSAKYEEMSVHTAEIKMLNYITNYNDIRMLEKKMLELINSRSYVDLDEPIIVITNYILLRKEA